MLLEFRDKFGDDSIKGDFNNNYYEMEKVGPKLINMYSVKEKEDLF